MACGRLLMWTFAAMFLVMTVDASCDPNQNTDSRGNNPACSNPKYPYCVVNQCVECNPYVSIDVCDCPSNQVCNEDFTSSLVGFCGSTPKYGQSCSSNSDCVTTFSDGSTFSGLVCLNKACRQCDPSGSQAVPYNCTNTYYGAERACISPGLWGIPGSKGTTTSGSPSPPTSSSGSPSPPSTGSAPTRVWSSVLILVTVLFSAAAAVGPLL